jgi:hypothetical protein
MIGEIPMRHHHPIFTVFGGAFVAERRDTAPPPRPRRERSKERWSAPLVMLLIAALLGATIPAVGITASRHLRAIEAARWVQPRSFSGVPPAAGFAQDLF